MIILKELQLTNFLSHDKTVIKFRDGQKIILSGASGSGKSSIVDAITWALYGQGRVDNRSLIQRGKLMARIDLTIEDEGTLYKIERIFTNKGKHTLLVLEGKTLKTLKPIKANGTREIQEYLEKEILHSSYLLFINSIVYPQDNIESFVKQTAARKKEIILEIINAASYDEYYEKTKSKINELQNEMHSSSVLLESLNSDKQENEIKIKQLDELKKKKVELTASLDRMKKERDELTEKMNDMKANTIKIETVKSEIERINNDIILHEDAIKEATVKIFNVNTADSQIASLENSIKDINKSKARLKELIDIKESASLWHEKMLDIMDRKPIQRDFDSEINEINQNIMKLMKQDFDMCPEIKKECPILIKKRDEEIEKWSADLISRGREKSKYIALVDDYTKEITALGEKPVVNNEEITQLTELVDNSIETEKKIIEIKQNSLNWKQEAEKTTETSNNAIKTLKNALTASQTELSSLSALISGIDGIRVNLNSLELQIMEVEEHLKNNDALLVVAELAKEKIKEIESKMKKIIDKNSEINDDIENMILLKDAFGSNGIKSILIDYIIPKLEDSINSILSKLSDFRVRLDTQKAGIGEGKVIEGLFINIFNEVGEQYDFDSFSGGEKVKISTAIFEAMAAIQNINFRVLDESVVALDDDSAEKFMDVIVSLQRRVSQMICISHMRNIQDLFSETITVNKINGVSKIIN